MSGLSDLDVSRETSERLRAFASLVRKWTPRINLVSRSSVDDLETRHIADSAQVFDIAPRMQKWADFGSGGGFPGIVCAILAKDSGQDTTFTLVESDQRKATFLRTAIRELDLNAVVLHERIEKLNPLGVGILSARALTDLTALLGFATSHLAEGGRALFPKGQSWEKEVAHARSQWSFDLKVHKSKTHDDAVILSIGDVFHV